MRLAFAFALVASLGCAGMTPAPAAPIHVAAPCDRRAIPTPNAGGVVLSFAAVPAGEDLKPSQVIYTTPSGQTVIVEESYCKK